MPRKRCSHDEMAEFDGVDVCAECGAREADIERERLLDEDELPRERGPRQRDIDGLVA